MVQLLFPACQVAQAESKGECVQQYRGLLDPSLLGQPVPEPQLPVTYDEALQGSSPQGALRPAPSACLLHAITAGSVC